MSIHHSSCMLICYRECCFCLVQLHDSLLRPLPYKPVSLDQVLAKVSAYSV